MKRAFKSREDFKRETLAEISLPTAMPHFILWFNEVKGWRAAATEDVRSNLQIRTLAFNTIKELIAGLPSLDEPK